MQSVPDNFFTNILRENLQIKKIIAGLQLQT